MLNWFMSTLQSAGTTQSEIPIAITVLTQEQVSISVFPALLLLLSGGGATTTTTTSSLQLSHTPLSNPETKESCDPCLIQSLSQYHLRPMASVSPILQVHAPHLGSASHLSSPGRLLYHTPALRLWSQRRWWTLAFLPYLPVCRCVVLQRG